MISRRMYNRVMRGKAPKKQSWNRQQRAEGFEEQEAVWIVKKHCARGRRKESLIPGVVKAVLVTRFWVEYMVGDSYHLNKYYPHQLEKRIA